MTAKKNLKRRARGRQRQTGERYTTALAAVKGERPRSSVEVLVLNDVSERAAAAGLKGRAFTSAALWTRASGEQERDLLIGAVLDRLVEVLRATAADASTVLLRDALLHGKPMPPLPRVLDWKQMRAFHAKQLAFSERLRLGVRGTSEDGRSISFEAPDPGGGPPVVLVATLSQTLQAWVLTRLRSDRHEAVVYLTLASEWLGGRAPLSEFLGSLLPPMVPLIASLERKP